VASQQLEGTRQLEGIQQRAVSATRLEVALVLAL
jgi:hypothetical protein